MYETLAKSPPASLFTLVTDVWTKPFWDAARERRLVAPRCGVCGTFRMPPSPFCPSCQSQQIEWITLSGRGTVYSHSAVTRAIVPEMEPCLPYITAVVELADAGGARLVTNVIDVPIDAVRIGMPVRVAWDDLGNGVVVPRFRCDEEKSS
jgi:uncharacterized protein